MAAAPAAAPRPLLCTGGRPLSPAVHWWAWLLHPQRAAAGRRACAAVSGGGLTPWRCGHRCTRGFTVPVTTPPCPFPTGEELSVRQAFLLPGTRTTARARSLWGVTPLGPELGCLGDGLFRHVAAEGDVATFGDRGVVVLCAKRHFLELAVRMGWRAAARPRPCGQRPWRPTPPPGPRNPRESTGRAGSWPVCGWGVPRRASQRSGPRTRGRAGGPGRRPRWRVSLLLGRAPGGQPSPPGRSWG